MYKFTDEGYVGVVPKALYRLVTLNSFGAGMKLCLVSVLRLVAWADGMLSLCSTSGDKWYQSGTVFRFTVQHGMLHELAKGGPLVVLA
jgi:hypothetical protein